jgi:hypothetical protein
MAYFGRISMALAGAVLIAFSCAAQDAGPPEHHPWGQFPVGSWKSVRVVSETLDAAGQVANVTTTLTRTTLTAVDDTSYTLRIETTVEIAGKQFASQPQVVRHGYHGETPGQGVSLRKTGDGELTIDGRTIPCEVRQLVLEADGVKRVSTIHYTSHLAPYQLRRETTTEGGPDEQKATTVVEVAAMGLPERVLGEMRTAAYLKTTRRLPQGTKVTMEIHCDEVPGGVVSHSASETDVAGNVVRRSTLELTDYAIGGHPPNADPVTRRRFFHRRTRKMDER